MANIKVAVRVRPVSQREIDVTGSEIVVHQGTQGIFLTNLKVSSSKAIDSRKRTKQYCFDYCFDSSNPTEENYASQATIYEALGQCVLDALFAGYNACLVAYGQSASGKTYTMMGSKDDPGLIPRICEGIFFRAKNEEEAGKSVSISVSYLEVYNEKVRDLLVPSANLNGLRVREHPRLGPYVQGLTQHPVETLESLMSRVEEGTKARKTASTLQNLTSSRSHALLTLSVEPSTGGISGQALSRGPGGSRRADFPRGCKLHLVDLAGSENSAACAGLNRLKEGANINKSLVALGNVISALAERSSTSQTSGRRFIPYRDSTLTWLLKDSLGGNATTIMLATISPASGSYNETSHTLRFAQRAQSVINKPVINEDPVAKIIRELRSEIVRLKALLLEKTGDPTTGSLCACQRVPDEQTELQDCKTRCVSTSTCNSPTAELVTSTPPSQTRRSSGSSDSIASKCESLNPPRQFGSPEFVPSYNESLQLTTQYNQAKISQLIDGQVDEPVFVDIPTLVAVLIKPDNSVPANSNQIEEISSDTTALEEAIEANETLRLPPSLSKNNENCNLQSLESSTNSNTQRASRQYHSPSFQILENVASKTQAAKLRKQCSLDIDTNSKSLQTDFKLDALNAVKSVLREETINSINGDTQSSKLNNIDENNDNKNSRKINELNESPGKTPKVANLDGPKRKTSKDSSSSSSKDEQIVISCIAKDTFLRRKNSVVEAEQSSTRTHTPIQRARRADIVAAVTERLYSSKKTSDESNTASTPASDIRSPENTEVKLASSTRMRLQEISRKMLAKRRRICVDTQTDCESTVRMRDVSTTAEEPKIISKDVSVLTDRHEDYENLSPCSNPILRVKEVSTSTSESPPPKLQILFKDASSITENSEDDYRAINTQQHDSGIAFDDSQTCYADSNLSSAGISDLITDTDKKPIEKSNKMIDNSSNTYLIDSDSLNTSVQTCKADILDDVCNQKCCKPKKCIETNASPLSNPDSCSTNTEYCSASSIPPIHNCHRPVIYDCNTNRACDCHRSLVEQPERNVISISLPDMINITIESSSVLESKIQVFDGNETANHRSIEVQTEETGVLEVATSIDKNLKNSNIKHSSTNTKNNHQVDNKTFRIENIFQNPHESLGQSLKINEVSDQHDYSSMSSLFTTSPRSARRKSLTSEWLTRNRNWPTLSHGHSPSRLLSHSNNSPDNNSSLNTTFASSFKNESIEKPEEVISWQDIHIKKTVENTWAESSTKILRKPVAECKETAPLVGSQKIVDTNFSDDSLDPKDERRVSKIIKPSIAIAEDRENDNICPPDVVAHTKKEINDTLGFYDKIYTIDDFDDTYIELPKSKPDPLIKHLATPVQEFKSLILGVPLIPLVLPEEVSRDEKKIESNKKKVTFGGSNVIETIQPSPTDSAWSLSSLKPIIKVNETHTTNKRNTLPKVEKSDGQNYTLDRKRVSFIDPSASVSSSKDNSDNNDENTRKRNILDDYLEEAIIFMRNINFINETIDPVAKKSPVKQKNRSCKYKNSDRKLKNESSDLECGPYDRCLKSMERLEQCLSKVKQHDDNSFDDSAETKQDLARFSSDSQERDYSSLDNISDKLNCTSNSELQPNLYNTRYYKDKLCNQLKSDSEISLNLDSQINHSKLQTSSSSKTRRRKYSKYSTSHPGTECNGRKPVRQVSNNFNSYPKLTEDENVILARVRKSLPTPKCSISKYDSSNENSSSNETLATFMESLDKTDRTKDRLKYPSSPRVKFLELLSERRRIIKDSRTTDVS